MIPRRRLAFVLAALPLALRAARASAQTGVAPVEVAVGETVTITLPRSPMIIDSESRAVATFELMPDGTAHITGVGVGSTRIVGQDFASVPMIIPVRVIAARPPRRRGG
jgi:hypothetical protein